MHDLIILALDPPSQDIPGLQISLRHCGLQLEDGLAGKCLLGLPTPIPICFHSQWNTGPPQLSTLWVVSNMFAGLCSYCSYPSCRTRLIKGWLEFVDRSVMSKAAGKPLTHLATRTSAGRERLPSECVRP